MPVDFDALALAPCLETFGEEILWQSCQDGVERIIPGIFDAGWRGQDVPGAFDGLSPTHVTTCLPVLGLRRADLPFLPKQGDRFQIRGENFVAQEIRPDSHGGIHVALNRGEAPEEPVQHQNNQGKTGWISP